MTDQTIRIEGCTVRTSDEQEGIRPASGGVVFEGNIIRCSVLIHAKTDMSNDQPSH